MQPVLAPLLQKAAVAALSSALRELARRAAGSSGTAIRLVVICTGRAVARFGLVLRRIADGGYAMRAFGLGVVDLPAVWARLTGRLSLDLLDALSPRRQRVDAVGIRERPLHFSLRVTAFGELQICALHKRMDFFDVLTNVPR